MRSRQFLPYALLSTLTVLWLLGGLTQNAQPGSRTDPWDERNLTELLKRTPSLRAVRIVATIDSVRDAQNLLSDVRTGDSVTGVYVFDTRSRDSTSCPTSGDYRQSGARSGIMLSAGNHRFGTDPSEIDFSIHIENFEKGNQFTLISRSNTCEPRLESGSCTATIDHIWWCLHDFTGDAVGDDGLPSGSLDLGNWESLVGLRVQGTVTDSNTNSTSPLLISATVTFTEQIRP
jgi:hypothetical protein